MNEKERRSLGIWRQMIEFAFIDPSRVNIIETCEKSVSQEKKETRESSIQQA